MAFLSRPPIHTIKVVTELLKELNEGVSGSYVEAAPEALVESDPGFLDRFDLVLATQVGACGGRVGLCQCQLLAAD